MGLPQEMEDEELTTQQAVYSRLDKIVQSSALVECINSILRPYLNTCKNQVTQEMLNLVIYYHNYRRYRDGVAHGNSNRKRANQRLACHLA